MSLSSMPEALKALDSLINRREKIKQERKIRKAKSGIPSKYGDQALKWLRNQIRNVRTIIDRLERDDPRIFKICR